MKIQKLWKNKEGLRQKSVKYFVLFLLFMVICSIISRGIYAMQIPKISTGKSERRSISHSIEAPGSVGSIAETAVNIKPGLLISQICVKEGQKIEEGTVLLQLEMQKLQEILENATKEAAVEEAKLKDQRANEQLTANERSQAKSRAGEDLSFASAAADASVGTAQQENDVALAELLNYPSSKDYIKNVKEKDTRYQELKNASKDKEAAKEARDAFKSYEETLEHSAKSDWEAGKKTLEDTAALKAAALRESQASRESEVQKAKRSLEDANTPEEQSVGTILEQQNLVDAKKKVCEDYQQIVDANGQVKSAFAGFVKRIFAEVGGLTADSAVMSFITEGSGDFEFMAVLNENQKAYANIGDMVSVSFEGGRNSIEKAPVEAIRQTEKGEYEVSAKIPSEGQTLGQSGKMVITSQGDDYNCCVPLSALFAENNMTYVLVVQEKETILGTELTVRRVDVVVEDKNESYAALSGSPLSEDDKIVTASDKEIIPGKEVREMEE